MIFKSIHSFFFHVYYLYRDIITLFRFFSRPNIRLRMIRIHLLSLTEVITVHCVHVEKKRKNMHTYVEMYKTIVAYFNQQQQKTTEDNITHLLKFFINLSHRVRSLT
jgi:hypothetical protein